MPVTIEGSRVLVTGAARGLGRAFTEELLRRGAATVYGGARDPAAITVPGVVPVRLDITDGADVRAAAGRCCDVDVLVNNAGVMSLSPLLSAPGTDQARAQMETNYFGTLAMCRAFAPVLGKNGGGALVNILSVVAWFAMPFNSSYCASKSAAWSLTNAARTELRRQGTLVTGVFAGLVDTEMSAAAGAPRTSCESVVAQTLDGIEAGAEEILADDRSRAVKAALPHDLTAVYPALQKLWDAFH
ncbi:short-chain dehydrogenase [Streptomyces sulfonofaciens]|uniref:Short-chain dehydrogenase n=1 Tax=Streptomyces sulfonofaciens TaxID=68272 RepID=A0A919L5E9_9ACTN|nr:SDR family oxidoreductase [Streptomyces sulfonofaciens]GHH84099.1 short-chain dehydrogenase [Streptomyces sulfonofaciens]